MQNKRRQSSREDNGIIKEVRMKSLMNIVENALIHVTNVDAWLCTRVEKLNQALLKQTNKNIRTHSNTAYVPCQAKFSRAILP